MELTSISTVAPVGSRGGAMYQKLYIQPKSAPEDGRISPETCWADLTRIMNEKVVASFWLFTWLWS